MRKRYTIKEAYRLGLIVEGKRIISEYSTGYAEAHTNPGIIGEVTNEYFYHHQNFMMGGQGQKNPSVSGFAYSYCYRLDDNRWIEFLDDDVSIHNAKFAITSPKEIGIRFLKDKESLISVLSEGDHSDVKIYKIEQVKTKIKIEE